MHVLDKFQFCPTCGSARFVAASEKSKRCEDCGFEYFLNPSAAVAALIVNEKNELLTVRRRFEPAKGTLDLPGGFCDLAETVLESLQREVKEETNLDVTDAQLLTTQPNQYPYSGFVVHTLDFFFLCKVTPSSTTLAGDDAAELLWIPVEELNPEDFGLSSIRQVVAFFKSTRLR